MKVFLFSVLTIALIIGGFFLFPDMSPEPSLGPLYENSVVVAFGDSITYGTGASDGYSWPEQLSEMTGISIINEGVPGETISKGLERLPVVVEKYDPQLVLLCEGGNDILRKRDMKEIAGDLDEMVSYLSDHMIDVVVMGVPAFGLSMSVPDFYREIAERYGAVYDGEILKKVLSDSSLKSDLVHPNHEGYRIIAEGLYSILSGAL